VRLLCTTGRRLSANEKVQHFAVSTVPDDTVHFIRSACQERTESDIERCLDCGALPAAGSLQHQTPSRTIAIDVQRAYGQAAGIPFSLTRTR